MGFFSQDIKNMDDLFVHTLRGSEGAIEGVRLYIQFGTVRRGAPHRHP
jgi:hypothetical protein